MILRNTREKARFPKITPFNRKVLTWDWFNYRLEHKIKDNRKNKFSLRKRHR